MSMTFSTKKGSVDSLKCFWRCGFIPSVDQMRWTVDFERSVSACGGSTTPLRAAVFGLGLERLADQSGDLLVLKCPGSARTAFVVEAHQALQTESLTPLAYARTAQTDLLADNVVRQPVCAHQDDFRPSHQTR